MPSDSSESFDSGEVVASISRRKASHAMRSDSSENFDSGEDVASISRRKASPGTPRIVAKHAMPSDSSENLDSGEDAKHAMPSDSSENFDSGEDVASISQRKAAPGTPRHGTSNVGSAAWQSKWQAMELDMFETNHRTESDAPRLDMTTHDSPPKPCEPNWSKWDTMEMDLRQAADDEFAAPRFALPEDAPCCVSPRRHAIDTKGQKKKKRKQKHAQAADTDTSADVRGEESDLEERDERPVAGSSSKTPKTPKTRLAKTPLTPRRPIAETHGKKAPITPKVAAPSLSVGSWVKLQGLNGRENLNGAKAQVEGWLADRGRWRVRCIGHPDAIFARTDNLILLDDCDSEDKGHSSRESHLQDGALEPMSPCVSSRTAGTAREPLPAIPDTFIEQCSSRCSSNSLTALLPKDDSVVSLTDRLNVTSDIERGCQGEHVGENPRAEPDVATILAYSEVQNFNSLAKTHEDVKLVLDAGLGVKDSTKAVDILHGAPLKAIRCFWRLWYALVLLCVLEFLLLGASVSLEMFWSPCHKHLKTCHSIHINDCEGISCEKGAPIWAPAWPLATFIFTVVPIRAVLSSGSSGGMPGRPRCMLVALLISVAVVGGGAASLSQMTGSIHYALRCPMQRSIERCGDHSCPAPCVQKSDFSPCVCGLLGEDEMARALFLSGAPACHPYEWYSWQMDVLEELLLRYETFACVFGPLGCTAFAIGGMLLLVQLSCCPVLLFGSWGLHLSLLVLFAPASTSRGKSREAPRVIGKRSAEDQAVDQSEEELVQLHKESDVDEKEQESRSSASDPREKVDDALRDEQTVKSEAI